MRRYKNRERERKERKKYSKSFERYEEADRQTDIKRDGRVVGKMNVKEASSDDSWLILDSEWWRRKKITRAKKKKIDNIQNASWLFRQTDTV